MKAKTFMGLCMGLLLVLLCHINLFSQDIRASLSGHVTDASRSAVPNAKVAVINTETHVVSPATGREQPRLKHEPGFGHQHRLLRPALTLFAPVLAWTGTATRAELAG